MICGVNEASQWNSFLACPSLRSHLLIQRKASLYSIKKKATGEGYGIFYREIC